MRSLAALALTALLVLASACGGDGGGGGERLSADEFRKQADQICREGDSKLAEVGEPDSLEGLGSYFEDAIPIFRDQTDQLDELQPPENLEDDWNRAIELNRRSLEIAEDAQEAAESKDQKKLQDAVDRGQKNEAELDRLARKLDLKVCGQEST